MADYPYPEDEGIRSIGIGILLTLVTCGIYGLFWQYKQIETLNAWTKRDDFSFWLWLLLSIVTFGIFAIYYEYKMAKAINEIQEDRGLRLQGDLAVICIVVSLFGFWFASLAIQQSNINRFYDETSDF
jgi:hypothetical protein